MTRPNFTKFSVTLLLLVTCGCGSVLFWRQCDNLCTSGFVIDVMFSHNTANGQNQRQRMFRPVRKVAEADGRQMMLRRYVWSRSPGGGTGEKSAFSDCILLQLARIHIVICSLTKTTVMQLLANDKDDPTFSHIVLQNRPIGWSVHEAMKQVFEFRGQLSKKLCCRRGTARRSLSVEILSTAAQLYEKSHSKRLTLRNVLEALFAWS